MCASGIELAGLAEQQRRHQGHDQRGSQQIEGVAEARMKDCVWTIMADSDHRAMRRFRVIDDPMVGEYA